MLRGFFSARRSVTVVVLLLVIIGIAVMLRGEAVIATPVERRDLLQTVVTTGRVTSLARVEVGTQILGSVAAVLVDSGDRVRAGEVLIRLRDDEARASLEQAQAVVKEYEERFKQIIAVDGPVSHQKLGEAEATFRQAYSNHERVRKLYDGGITSRAELDEAVRQRDVAASTVEREKLMRDNSKPQGGDIKLVEARLGQARAAVAVARDRLARTIITAPGDGTVIGRKVEVGDVVQPGTPLLVLSRNGRTQVTAQVDEKNLGLLRVGQSVVCSADSYPDKTFPARLATVVPAVDPQRGTVEARCDVDEPPEYLVPDMTVSLEIEVARHPKVLTTPTESIRDAATAPWALVVRDGRAVRQNVTLGIRGSGSCEIVNGLKEGDLVLPGSCRVSPGARVRPQRTEGGSGRAY